MTYLKHWDYSTGHVQTTDVYPTREEAQAHLDMYNQNDPGTDSCWYISEEEPSNGIREDSD